MDNVRTAADRALRCSGVAPLSAEMKLFGVIDPTICGLAVASKRLVTHDERERERTRRVKKKGSRTDFCLQHWTNQNLV